MFPSSDHRYDPATLVGTSNFATILMGNLVGDFEPSLGYEVDSQVSILTKSIVNEFRSMFEILDNIGILLPNHHLVLNNHPLEGIIVFVDQMFIGLRHSFLLLVHLEAMST